jgi:hypothetical protein
MRGALHSRGLALSVYEDMTGDWKEKVQRRIERVGQVLIICG